MCANLSVRVLSRCDSRQWVCPASGRSGIRLKTRRALGVAPGRWCHGPLPTAPGARRPLLGPRRPPVGTCVVKSGVLDAEGSQPGQTTAPEQGSGSKVSPCSCPRCHVVGFRVLFAGSVQHGRRKAGVGGQAPARFEVGAERASLGLGAAVRRGLVGPPGVSGKPLGATLPHRLRGDGGRDGGAGLPRWPVPGPSLGPAQGLYG